MLHPLLILALALTPLEDPKPAADPARVRAAVQELDRALRGTSREDKLKAIQAGSEVLDADVARALAKGIGDKEPDVRRSSIEALRFLAHPAAVDALHDAARTRKELRKEPALYAALLRAIGQHASAASVPVLAADVLTVPEHAVVQARILGLGRIRTAESVAALMELMKVAGPQRIQNLMPDFRLALVQLTGVDKGQSQELWQAWWSAERAKLRVAPEPPALPRELRFRWDAYWGKEAPYERQRRRGERGHGDPETGR
jgi:hypothetical protein